MALVGQASSQKPLKSSARQTIKLNRPRGQVRVTAARGKVELQMDTDFGAVDPRKLELAVRALLDKLDL